MIYKVFELVTPTILEDRSGAKTIYPSTLVEINFHDWNKTNEFDSVEDAAKAIESEKDKHKGKEFVMLPYIRIYF